MLVLRSVQMYVFCYVWVDWITPDGEIEYQGMRTLEKLGVHDALSDEVGFRGPSGIPQIFRYEL